MNQDKIVCDLAVFRSLKSCVGEFHKPNTNEFCARGKLAQSCGSDLKESMSIPNEVESKENKIGLDINSLYNIACINNNRDFEKADTMILTLAMESGNVEFINGLPEDSIKTLTLQEV
jgi:hypothetical protein